MRYLDWGESVYLIVYFVVSSGPFIARVGTNSIMICSLRLSLIEFLFRITVLEPNCISIKSAFAI